MTEGYMPPTQILQTSPLKLFEEILSLNKCQWIVNIIKNIFTLLWMREGEKGCRGKSTMRYFFDHDRVGQGRKNRVYRIASCHSQQGFVLT